MNKDRRTSLEAYLRILNKEVTEDTMGVIREALQSMAETETRVIRAMEPHSHKIMTAVNMERAQRALEGITIAVKALGKGSRRRAVAALAAVLEEE